MNKQGLLIYNGFLKHRKYFDLVEQMINAAKQVGVPLKAKGNHEVLTAIDKDGVRILTEDAGFDFVIFWDKDIWLARNLEKTGKRLFNTSNAIESCDDKMRTHHLLAGHGICMPRTIPAPKTYASAGYVETDFLDLVAETLGFPMIVKENFGSFGQQVYKAEDRDGLLDMMARLAGKPFLFQEFIQASEGKDIRLHIVGGEAVACMYRYNDLDFRANVTNGGKMKPYAPSKEQIELAVKSCALLGLDFAGVDILFGKDGEPTLCEVNSNAHMKNILDCTGVNVAEFIMRHVKRCVT